VLQLTMVQIVVHKYVAEKSIIHQSIFTACQRHPTLIRLPSPYVPFGISRWS